MVQGVVGGGGAWLGLADFGLRVSARSSWVNGVRATEGDGWIIMLVNHQTITETVD